MRLHILASALILGLAPAALAEGFPRIVGSGENASVEYGPGPQRNIVGGGALVQRVLSNGEFEVTYLETAMVQLPPAGLRPVLVGSGENTELSWVPFGAPARLASAAR